MTESLSMFLCECVSENIFFVVVVLKIKFTGHGILAWQYFF